MVLQRGESVLHICVLFCWEQKHHWSASHHGSKNSVTGSSLKTKNTSDQIQNFLKLMGAF